MLVYLIGIILIVVVVIFLYFIIKYEKVAFDYIYDLLKEKIEVAKATELNNGYSSMRN